VVTVLPAVIFTLTALLVILLVNALLVRVNTIPLVALAKLVMLRTVLPVLQVLIAVLLVPPAIPPMVVGDVFPLLPNLLVIFTVRVMLVPTCKDGLVVQV
jgi:hypothetical protein